MLPAPGSDHGRLAAMSINFIDNTFTQRSCNISERLRSTPPEVESQNYGALFHERHLFFEFFYRVIV
jgi:hypothetical protein